MKLWIELVEREHALDAGGAGPQALVGSVPGHAVAARSLGLEAADQGLVEIRELLHLSNQPRTAIPGPGPRGSRLQRGP